ncbi:hypothetical protein Rhopal_007062-T1 [Rhodotorula paludigena]|uniref:Zn(2)-C6 fungal-type domain-containing protein n=1 Tax=Rhodotorula paludigena TaxID=86838 RepID=A0AAV5GTZ3_9BASI|nr:hypothetical protein Rhopal_007062-T1 [Rhodotorula paludigena]
MTRPIPVDGQRKRPSKSCLACRAAKAKCTGLNEDYLHALEDPALLAAWEGPAPRCSRCTRIGSECDFAPSRRKGRPRRLPKPSFGEAVTERNDDLPAYPSPPPEAAALLAAAAIGRPTACFTRLLLPRPVLIQRYLAAVYSWAPILPDTADGLDAYLEELDSTGLRHALTCILDPTVHGPLHPPSFKAGTAPLDTIQTSLLLAIHSFATKDPSRAAGYLQWACTELRLQGWAGEATPAGLGAPHADLFMRTGWFAWCTEINMGFMSGVRASILTHVPPPAARHALWLAYEATDHDGLWSLESSQRAAVTAQIVARSQRLHTLARDTLSQLVPPTSVLDSSPAEANLRFSLFNAALVSLTATIQHLSSVSPLSPLVAPALPCSIDTTCAPPPLHRTGIIDAAKRVLAFLRDFAPYCGAPWSDWRGTSGGLCGAEQADEQTRIFGPMLGCCLVVAARGCLLEAEALQAGEGSAEDGAARRVAKDLELCEAELRRQAKQWPATETLAAEVGLLRRTAGV